jgi:hypothetical protein
MSHERAQKLIEKANKRDHGHTAGGPLTGDAVLAAAAPFSNTPYQWGGGHGALPGATYSSGHGRSGLGLDCSGYARAVLANMGISVNGTADQLLSEAKSHPSKNRLQPGDLVFYEGRHPNHVMVYIGNGQVIGETHTGAQTIRRSSRSTTCRSPAPAVTSSRRRRAAGAAVAAAGQTRRSGSTARAFPTSSRKERRQRRSTSRRRPPSSPDPNCSRTARSSPSRKRPERAGKDDDLAALKRARAELEKLQKTASKKEQVPIAKELASINRQRDQQGDIDNAKLKKKLAEQQAAWKKHAATRGLAEAPSRAGGRRETARRCSGRQQGTPGVRGQLLPCHRSGVEGVRPDHREGSVGAGRGARAAHPGRAEDQGSAGRPRRSRRDARSRQRSRISTRRSRTATRRRSRSAGRLDQAQFDQQMADLQVQADAERKQRDDDYAQREQATRTTVRRSGRRSRTGSPTRRRSWSPGRSSGRTSGRS